MTEQVHSLPQNKVALWYTHVFHPFGLPFLLLILLRWEFIFRHFFLLAFIAPAMIAGIAFALNKRWNKKVLFKKLAYNDPMVYFRLVLPMALAAGTIINIFLSSAIAGPGGSLFQNMLLVTFLIALFCRWFFNVSIHQISIGLLAGVSFLAFPGDEFHLLSMGCLTLALILGRVQFFLQEHKILESLAGFVIGCTIGYLVMNDPNLVYWYGYLY